MAAKFNCEGAFDLKSSKLRLTDLNPSFDLIYPNVSSQMSRDRQYLLAYQYNLVHGAKGNTPPLPLFAWNLEGNEDIALQGRPLPWYRNMNKGEENLKDKILQVLDPKQTLPVPFGRRPMSNFSLFCEKKLVENAYNSKENKSSIGKKFNCLRKPKNALH